MFEDAEARGAGAGVLLLLLLLDRARARSGRRVVVTFGEVERGVRLCGARGRRQVGRVLLLLVVKRTVAPIVAVGRRGVREVVSRRAVRSSGGRGGGDLLASVGGRSRTAARRARRGQIGLAAVRRVAVGRRLALLLLLLLLLPVVG